MFYIVLQARKSTTTAIQIVEDFRFLRIAPRNYAMNMMKAIAEHVWTGTGGVDGRSGMA